MTKLDEQLLVAAVAQDRLPVAAEGV